MDAESRRQKSLLARLSTNEAASLGSLDTFIAEGSVPRDLEWQPSYCVVRGAEKLLIHKLASTEFPVYIEKAVEALKPFPNAKVFLLATDVLSERGEVGVAATQIYASNVASSVAQKAILLGCGLLVESEGAVHLLCEPGYIPPTACTHGEETGHIPKWLYTALANSTQFSPYLTKRIKKFTKAYEKATRRKSISNAREAEILLNFAEDATKGDLRLFFPVDDLRMFRQFEMSKANRRARDHFFHTFNNLFLGLFVLAKIADCRQSIADIDRFIKRPGKTNLFYWESLWLLTCLFHDPAYMAEHFWATLRFTYGVPQRESLEEPDIPEEVKAQIRNLWESEFAAARRDLRTLYNRTVRKWTPGTAGKSTGPDVFESALKRAYFDGKGTTHSLVSGLRLISQCRTQQVPTATAYKPQLALTACFIAALCMMFHDQRCRAALQSAGIPPIAFEHLPYATLLMYVDSLQDDRRDISKDRFPDHGVLASLEVLEGGKSVKAVVCLPELPISEWPKRIVEYHSVLEWINAESEIKFIIDYETRAGLPPRVSKKAKG